MITISNLDKTYYQNGIPFAALKNINLHVNPGEIFGIIGKSGAGKSTLIRCVNLLEKPSCGQVLVDGSDLTQISAKKLRKIRRQIGMVFQHFNLLQSRTVFANIALPLELAGGSQLAIQNKVNSLLALVDLQKRANYYPDSLSGGQNQRVAIARALVSNPKVLLCDEITSALDPESTKSILKLLQKINSELGITILIITHEMDVIKSICDRVGILENGELVEQGDVISIFTEPKASATKKLTQASLHLELPGYLQARLKPDFSLGLKPVIRLVFSGKTANEPIVVTLHERYQVTANILLADLEQIHGSVLGFLLCKLEGEDDSVELAINYLKNLNINAEVIGYE